MDQYKLDMLIVIVGVVCGSFGLVLWVVSVFIRWGNAKEARRMKEVRKKDKNFKLKRRHVEGIASNVKIALESETEYRRVYTDRDMSFVLEYFGWRMKSDE